MCEFKSAIVMADGDLLHNPWTDSHEDLVRLFKLKDTATPRGDMRFARVEFKPDKPEDLADVSKYKLRIDEARQPEWFSERMEEKTIDKLKLIVSGMIITGDADLLCGGVYILGKGARISSVQHCKIVAMIADSSVGEMRGSSNVGVMWESSNVGVMRESSKVGVMWGSSNVGVMWGSSNVGEMRESSNVGAMRESSKVGEMRESSKVEKDYREKKNQTGE